MEKPDLVYKVKCLKCLIVYPYYIDSCLECGSNRLYEFHEAGCECIDCEKLFHLVVIPEKA